MTSDANGWPDASKPGVPLNPEKDGWHWLLIDGWSDMPEPRWWSAEAQCWGVMKPVQPSAISFIWQYREPCFTPSEAQHYTRAAAAAAWIAAREACAEYADREEAYSSKRANTDNQHDQVWFSSSEATAGSIASHIRALPPPADAAAALAEVVEKARREAFEEAAQAVEGSIAVKLRLLDPHVERLHCDDRYRDVRAAYAAAIRARLIGGAA